MFFQVNYQDVLHLAKTYHYKTCHYQFLLDIRELSVYIFS